MIKERERDREEEKEKKGSPGGWWYFRQDGQGDNVSICQGIVILLWHQCILSRPYLYEHPAWQKIWESLRETKGAMSFQFILLVLLLNQVVSVCR